MEIRSKITEVQRGAFVLMPVGKRYVRISVEQVVDIGQDMVMVYYRNSLSPYRVPADTKVVYI